MRGMTRSCGDVSAPTAKSPRQEGVLTRVPERKVNKLLKGSLGAYRRIASLLSILTVPRQMTTYANMALRPHVQIRRPSPVSQPVVITHPTLRDASHSLSGPSSGAYFVNGLREWLETTDPAGAHECRRNELFAELAVLLTSKEVAELWNASNVEGQRGLGRG